MDKEQFYKEFFRYLECGSCADLEFCQKQLEPACKTGSAIYRKLKMEDLEKENEQLKQQLKEKDELLRQQIGKMKSTDFIKMCVSCGFMVEAKEIDNQTAIAELEKLKNYLPNIALDIPDMVSYRYLKKQIDQQIKSLKGESR